MLISTLVEVPGHTIATTQGPVFGLCVRTRTALAQTGARLQATLGGGVGPMTAHLSSSRYDAVTRLTAAATEMGAHAVLGVRVEVSELGGSWIEICAYGTAVTLDPPPANPDPLDLLPATTDPPIACPDCAEPVDASAGQCPFCGAHLEPEREEATLA